MTLYDKGLIKAMKQAYRDNGYYVAVTENGVLIQTAGWGVEIIGPAVPNSVKSLIVLHNGTIPKMNSAVNIQKNECASAILETVIATMDDLSEQYTATGGVPIKPTRLTLDGMRVWQTTTDLKMKLVDAADQHILADENWDANLVGDAIYGRTWFGSMYVRPEYLIPLEDIPLIKHLEQMQWIPLDGPEE